MLKTTDIARDIRFLRSGRHDLILSKFLQARKSSGIAGIAYYFGLLLFATLQRNENIRRSPYS
jgi:hypothetical protein